MPGRKLPSRGAWLRRFGAEAARDRAALGASLAPHELAALGSYYWQGWARDRQLPPERAWRTWLICAGRGFGKTRAGAEWVRDVARHDGSARIALVGASLSEVRQVMVEGDSGVLAASPGALAPVYEPSLRRLTWENGAMAWLYSAAEPDSLRGPQHSHASRARPSAKPSSTKLLPVSTPSCSQACGAKSRTHRLSPPPATATSSQTTLPEAGPGRSGRWRCGRKTDGSSSLPGKVRGFMTQAPGVWRVSPPLADGRGSPRPPCPAAGSPRTARRAPRLPRLSPRCALRAFFLPDRGTRGRRRGYRGGGKLCPVRLMRSPVFCAALLQQFPDFVCLPPHRGKVRYPTIRWLNSQKGE